MGQQLPGTTRFLIGTSELLQHYGLWFLLLLGIGGLIWRWWLTDDKRRRRWHQVILRLPVIGRVSRGLNTARFARTLSILNASAVPLLEGMKIAGKCSPTTMPACASVRPPSGCGGDQPAQVAG